MGTLKHIPHPDFAFDTPKSDTWRHAEAGAQVVAGVSPREIATFRRWDTETLKLRDLLTLFKGEKLDVIILEGFKEFIKRRRDVLKIVTAKDREDLEWILSLVAPPIAAITGPIAKSNPPRGKVPIIDIETEGERLLRLLSF